MRRQGRAEDRIPRLASDVVRSYTVAGVALVPLFGLPVIIALATDGVSFDVLTASTLLIGWSFVALFSSVLTWLVFRRASGVELARWLAGTTPTGTLRRVLWSINGGGAVSWAITGSAIAIVAVVLLGFNATFRTEPLVVYPAVAVVICSIFMIISAYAVRYAREDALRGGMQFAGVPTPRFAEYFYVSVQVATTFSPSDVVITSSSMRTIVAVHSLISFAFNTIIIALLVSVLITTVP